MDLSKYSDEDLEKLLAGDYSVLTDEDLEALASTEDQKPKTGRFSLNETLKNIPSSAAGVARSMAQPFVNPVGTLEALGGLIESGVEAVNPFMTDEDRRYSQYGEAFVGNLKDRYGSPEAALNTLQTDPVGMAMDASGALGLAGKVTRVPALTRAGMAIDPLNAVLNTGKAVVGKMTPRHVPADWYQSVAKFPPASVDRKTRAKITETALDEGIMPTGKGIDKANMILEGLDEKIDDLISASDKAGKTASRRAIYSELTELRKTLVGGASAPKNMRKFQKVLRELDKMLEQGPDRWTPSRLQEFKTKTYRDINWKKDPDATTATYQALARGARKKIEQMVPEIADVNQRYGPLAELRDRLPQVANRIDNHNPFSLSTGVYTGAGAAAGDMPGAVAGGLLSMANNPQITAAAAIWLRKLQNQGLLGNLTDNSTLPWMIRQGLFQSGRLEGLE